MPHQSWRHDGALPSRPRLEVADILQTHVGGLSEQGGLNSEQRRAIKDITRCRTMALGGHLEKCTACGDEHPAYNSCRNRHCPKCQALPQARWVDRQVERVLPVRCFHVVFTLPAELRPIARRHPRELYELLFAAASSTLLDFGRDPKWLGAQLGVTVVLHTWARDLSLHPHVHCIVTAGGLSADGQRWADARHNFLFPVGAMAKTFRGKFLDGLRKLRLQHRTASHVNSKAFGALLDKLYNMTWNVYAKAPFAGPSQIFRYLGQYTHRVGISNHRLLAWDGREVTFRTRGEHSVTLKAEVFVKRFLVHILPKHFVKIRHYGLMANGGAVRRRERARALLAQRNPVPDEIAPPQLKLADADWKQALAALTGIDLARTALVREPLPSIARVQPRAPPLPRVAA